jgi:hypothetical protein
MAKSPPVELERGTLERGAFPQPYAPLGAVCGEPRPTSAASSSWQGAGATWIRCCFGFGAAGLTILYCGLLLAGAQ